MRASLACFLVALAGCGPATSRPGPIAAVTICPEGSSPGASGACVPEAAPRKEPADRKEGDPKQNGPTRRTTSAPGLRGNWHGEDSDAWGYYELSVSEDGSFRQEITQLAARDTGPVACVQEGRLTLEDDHLLWHYSNNGCNHAYDNDTVTHTILEMNGHEFTEHDGSSTVHYERQR